MTRSSIEDVASYLVKAPLSLKKLVYLDGQWAVVYRSKMNPGPPPMDAAEPLGDAALRAADLDHPHPGAAPLRAAVDDRGDLRRLHRREPPDHLAPGSLDGHDHAVGDGRGCQRGVLGFWISLDGRSLLGDAMDS